MIITRHILYSCFQENNDYRLFDKQRSTAMFRIQTNMPRRHRTSRHQIAQSKSDETCELSTQKMIHWKSKKVSHPQQKTNPTWKKKQSYANKTVSGWMKFQVRLCSNRRRAQVFVYACYSLRWSGSGRESWVGGCVSCWQKDQSKMVQETGNEEKLEILLMEEILHHLGWLKP